MSATVSVASTSTRRDADAINSRGLNSLGTVRGTSRGDEVPVRGRLGVGKRGEDDGGG